MPADVRPDPLHDQVVKLQEELDDLLERRRKGRIASNEEREVGLRIRDLEREVEKLRILDLRPSGRLPTAPPSSRRAAAPSSSDPAASKRKKALEVELGELREKQKDLKLPPTESERIGPRIHKIEEELATLDEAPASTDWARPPQSSKWVDPGHGAPSLPMLLMSLVIGGLIMVSIASKCSSLGPHGAYKPTVQHKEPLNTGVTAPPKSSR